MEKYLKIGWAGYGFMPYIKEIVNEKGKRCQTEWYITIEYFKENFANYSNWEQSPYIELLMK